MQKLVNYLRGWTRMVVSGPFPERTINLCARQNVRFWAVEQVDESTLRMTVLRRDAARAQALAAQAGCTAQVERGTGMPFFLARFHRRYAFLLGLALSVTTVAALSRIVLTVEITGNERVPDAVILSQLRREGLRPGVFGPNLDTRQIELDTRLALEELAWVGINLYGTRAQVVVRETVPPPAVLEQEGVSDVVARAGGLILSIDAVQGQAMVEPGAIVAPGEVLISGTVTMEGPQYSDIAPSYLCVRAAGEVRARTWRTVRASIPTQTAVKRYTGQRRVRWSLTVFERRINFYANGSISWENYDKISKTHSVTLPGAQRLPIFLTREEYRRWQPERTAVDADAAQRLLQQCLQSRLAALVGDDGSIVRTDWSARIADGLITVTGSAECEEQIGVSAPPQKIGE